MTDRLDEIRKRLERSIHYGAWARDDIAYLLAEVERLRAELTAKRPKLKVRRVSRQPFAIELDD